MNIKSFKKKFKLRRVCIWFLLIILFMTFKISTHISKHPFTMMFNSNKTTLDSIQICLVTGTLLSNFIEQLSIHESQHFSIQRWKTVITQLSVEDLRQGGAWITIIIYYTVKYYFVCSPHIPWGIDFNFQDQS